MSDDTSSNNDSCSIRDSDDDDDDDKDATAAAAASSRYSASDWTATKLAEATYKDLGNPSEVEERFVRHLLLQHYGRHNIQQLLQQESSMTSRDYSMSVDAFDLLRADPVLGFMLIRYPATLLPVLERAIVRAQEQLYTELTAAATLSQPSTAPAQPPFLSVKGGVATATRVHARLVHLPPTCCKPTLGMSLSADDVGKLWQVSGTVVRTGPVQMYESARAYKCCGVKAPSFGAGGGGGGWRGKKKSGGANSESNKNKQGNNNNNNKQPCCGREFMVHADLEQRNNALQEPETCPGTLPNGERCPGNQFEVVEGGSVHTDYQEIKIQDAANHGGGNNSGAGHIPRSLLIKLQHDLVDHCQPGDEVVSPISRLVAIDATLQLASHQ